MIIPLDRNFLLYVFWTILLIALAWSIFRMFVPGKRSRFDNHNDAAESFGGGGLANHTSYGSPSDHSSSSSHHVGSFDAGGHGSDSGGGDGGGSGHGG